MNICYLLESTCLCGGVKVVFRQAEALTKMGHTVTVMSEESYPEWFDGDVMFIRKNPFSAELDESFDFLVLTTPHLVLFHYRYSDTKKIVHLVQGYEGNYIEGLSFIDKIEEAYKLPILKITVSERLSAKLEEKMPGKYFSIGQGLEQGLFFPTSRMYDRETPENIILIGPSTISVKHIEIGLKAFALVKQQNPSLKLVRISQVETRHKDEEHAGPIADYFVNISPKQVGQILRNKPGLLISPSDAGEGFGLPVLEAMASGVPTVITDIPSYKSFSNPVDYSKFVQAGSAESMAQGILEIIDDQKERTRIIKRGLEVASDYRYEKVAQKLEAVLLNAK